MSTGPEATATATLDPDFHGEILRPGDPAYDAARTLHNAMIDRRPALIVRPGDSADVLRALEFARASGSRGGRARRRS